MHIIPAILPETFEALQLEARQAAKVAECVQVDVCDGVFVPHRSWPFQSQPDPDFDALMQEEQGLPEWQKLNYEVDLMVSDPAEVARKWIMVGASRVVLHIESSPTSLSILQELRAAYGGAPDSPTNIVFGVSLQNETPLETLYPFLPHADFVQLMGISRIGFQGEPFDGRVLERITQLRERYPALIISVDGAVDADTAPRLIKAGASRLVVGSYLSEGSMPERVAHLESLFT